MSTTASGTNRLSSVFAVVKAMVPRSFDPEAKMARNAKLQAILQHVATRFVFGVYGFNWLNSGHGLYRFPDSPIWMCLKILPIDISKQRDFNSSMFPMYPWHFLGAPPDSA